MRPKMIPMGTNPWNDLQKQIEIHRPSKLVISSEALWGLKRQGIGIFADRLKGLSEDIEIVAYLRRQDQYLEAQYKEALKSGLTANPMTFCEKRFALAKYDEILGMWAEYFGETSLKINLYEKDWNQKFDILNSLFSILGINREGFVQPTFLTNKSPSALVSDFLLLLNTSGYKYEQPKLCRLLIENTSEMAQLKSMLTYEQRVRMLNFFADGNRIVFKKFLLDKNHETFPAIADSEESYRCFSSTEKKCLLKWLESDSDVDFRPSFKRQSAELDCLAQIMATAKDFLQK